MLRLLCGCILNRRKTAASRDMKDRAHVHNPKFETVFKDKLEPHYLQLLGGHALERDCLRYVYKMVSVYLNERYGLDCIKPPSFPIANEINICVKTTSY